MNARAHQPGLIVDLFAGGGGASAGIELALGRSPDIAVNHDPAAIEMHAANHPDTRHECKSVWDVTPRIVGRREVALLWASPDCTHHSRAKGGKPRRQEIRDLAWVVVEWARETRPRVICLENVPEFEGWGPLGPDNRPIPERAGETFQLFVGRLRLLGYTVEWRVLAGADYGAPTTRERLFLVARLDGAPVWPAPSHGTVRPAPWRTSAECIDWTIPNCSIFATPEEAKAWRKRVGAAGVPRRPLAEATQRRIAEGLRRYVLEAAEPFILTTGHQSSDSGKVRGLGEPLSTVVTKAEHCLVAPSLTKFYGSASAGARLDAPVPTVTAGGGRGGGHLGLVSAWVAKHYTGMVGQDARAPLGTITARDHHSVQPVSMARGEQALGRARAVAGFITKYYGSGGQWSGLGEPMHTIVSRARMGLVTVELDGEPYTITDIGLRMLQPRELARAQGFPDDYVLTGTKAQQVARIGNSVCPQVVEALVRAQFEGGVRAEVAA